jgi:parallel beta-helix repeat protein
MNINAGADLTDPGALVSRSPIHINGNTEFTTINGVISGSGSPVDPFIIENWDIEASTTIGISIQNTDAYFTIRNVRVHDGGKKYNGIDFLNVENGKIENSNIINNWFGFYIHSSFNNHITLSNISHNWYGIRIRNSNNNSIIYNVLDSTKNHCIILFHSSGNKILGNIVSNSGDSGIIIYEFSEDNKIYHNNIISSHRHNGEDKQVNQWDNGYPSGGNYWDDYTGVDFFKGPNQDMPGSDGFGDTPYYPYFSRSKDRYPLMSPWKVTNELPIADCGSDQIVSEGDVILLNGSTSFDPDGTIESYEWDFYSSDGLWWETGATPDATGLTATHTYGDDGEFIVTLRVTDNDDLSATDISNVTVLNVDPTVTIESITMDIEIGLRVAGRKFNDVGMTLYKDGNSIGYISIERMPGSPDDQMAWIPISIDFSKSYTATVTYIPDDPPNIGANPVWIYIKSENGSIKKIHHTFNVQQSKKRDSDHWNHVEPWEVDLSSHFIGLPIEITSHITDPGSDDEYLTYTYGSQIVNKTYLNNPPNPDTYPSPEYNPRDIIDITFLIYEGIGTITMVAKDDDNIRLGIGQGSDSIEIK